MSDSTALDDATTHQARAGAALTAALRDGPSHAYLFQGPPGSGKKRIARAFAAEILVMPAATIRRRPAAGRCSTRRRTPT